MKELISGMENLPEFQGMGDNIQTILEKFVKIDQNLFMEIIEKRSSSSHVFTIPEFKKIFCFVLYKVKFSIEIQNADATFFHNRKRHYAVI